MTGSVQSDLFAAGVAECGFQLGLAFPEAIPKLQGRLDAVDSMSEAEVLAHLVARCSPAGTDPAAATAALLARFGSIGRVFGAPHADLARTVGPHVAVELTVLHSLLVRMLSQPLRQRELISSWDAAKTYLQVRLAALPREVFHVLFLDTKNHLILDERMSEGSVNRASVYPREVVRRALELSAAAVLLAHNHPTGDPTPSATDIEVTKQIVAAAKPLEIAVFDHLIVGGTQVVSLRALGLM